MLEEEEDSDAIKETYNNHHTRISIWSGLILSLVLGFLSYILYSQVRLSLLLSPFSLDYSEYKKFGILSDLHLDVNQNDTFCRLWNGTLTHYQSSYGSQGCDTRYNFAEFTIDSFSTLLEDFGNADLIFSLGDIVNHYTNTQKGTENVFFNATALFHTKLHVPVYSTLGNNDMPEDYLQPNNSVLFYETVWNRFSLLMNASSASLQKYKSKETFVAGGYYTLEHSKELQIVSLNSINFSLKSNVNTSVGLQQLHWLSEVLSDAKNNHRSIIIIGHVCPSQSLYQVSNHRRTMMWKEVYILEYNKIVSAYSDVIKFSLFSHHHTNSWFVKYEEQTGGYVSYFILPSISPIYENQPAYSIGIFDDGWNLIDLWHYFCPLSFYTRQNQEPQYIFQFSFKGSYFYSTSEVKDIPITNNMLLDLTSKLVDVHDMQDTYRKVLFNSYQFFYNFGKVSPYQMYCSMTRNTASSIAACFADYKYNYTSSNPF